MKRLLLTLLSLFFMNTAFASDHAQLTLKIANPVKENKYFLCLYGIGCLSIRAGNNGKVFPLLPTDLGNIQKIVITDVTSMRMDLQPSVKSCDVKINQNQRLMITGQLIVRNNTPYINHLHCSVI